MSRENEQAPERISLFSSASNAPSKADSSIQDTAILSPYDPPVNNTVAQPVAAMAQPEPAVNTASDPKRAKQEKKARKAEEKALRRQNGAGGKKKKVLIGAGITAGVLAAAYFSGVYVYSNRFFPHTSFGAVDVSNETFADATKLIDDTEKNYSLAVAGQGLDFEVTPTESGMDINAEQIVDAARTTMNPWTWPVQLFKEHNMADSFSSDNQVVSIEIRPSGPFKFHPYSSPSDTGSNPSS